MKLRNVLAAIGFVILTSCGDAPPKAAAPEPAHKAEVPKPADESRRFPAENQTGTSVVDKELLGKAFMPGGTLAKYKKGKAEYEMFVAKAATPTDAAILLLEWKNALTGAKLIPSFGGYFGQDGGRGVFVFTKGAWIAGIAGLSEKDADAQGRIFAARLP